MVKQLGDVVSFYKVGLELLMSGGMDVVVQALVGEGKQVFIDLKLPNDIPETVARTVSVAAKWGVRFLTVSNSVTDTTIAAAVAGRGASVGPELLFVPFLSSQSRADFAKLTGQSEDGFERFLLERTEAAKAAGVDGFIVSGDEIGLLRRRFPDTVLVSPGIRPAGAATNDHQRSCTPSQAVLLGADYLVVGRPIRDASDRVAAVRAIVDDIARG